MRGIRLTKGFLLELKRRLRFIEDARRLLEMKRDGLIKELTTRLDEVIRFREEISARAEKLRTRLASFHSAYGTDELKTYPAYLDERLSVELISKSIMGVIIPELKSIQVPDLRNKYPPHVISLAKEVSSFTEILVELSILEFVIERLSEELRKTNIQVNALKNVIIPSYKSLIKRLEDMLSEEMLEEFVRIKMVKDILMRRRA